MKFKTAMYVCVQPEYKTSPAWWRLDTLSYMMRGSKRMLLGGGITTWKECYKLGWRCIKVQMTLTKLKSLNKEEQ